VLGLGRHQKGTGGGSWGEKEVKTAGVSIVDNEEMRRSNMIDSRFVGISFSTGEKGGGEDLVKGKNYLGKHDGG